MTDQSRVLVGLFIGVSLTVFLAMNVGALAVFGGPWFVGVGVIAVEMTARGRTVVASANWNFLLAFWISFLAGTLLLLTSAIDWSAPWTAG